MIVTYDIIVTYNSKSNNKKIKEKENRNKKWNRKICKSYAIEEIALDNAIKLKLLVSIKIYLVVNISKIVRYKEQVEKQKVEEVKLVKVDRAKKIGSRKNIKK